MEAAREMARQKDGGPPRWFSPLECGGAGAGGRVPAAPTLLYLPGTYDHFPLLGNKKVPSRSVIPMCGLEVRCLNILLQLDSDKAQLIVSLT